MAGKRRFVVKLTAAERDRLGCLISSGKAAAATLMHARILLKADEKEGESAWTDAAIAGALESSLTTVHRVRQTFVEQGLERALQRKLPTGRRFHKLDGAQEARLVVLACSEPPEGRSRWTLKLLADKLVELEVVDSVSPECVRTTLKKTNSNRG